jgi:Cu2+-exporting ATPase
VEVLGVAMDEKTREAAMPALDGLRALGLQVAVLSGDLKERVVAFAQRLSGSPPVWVAGAAVGPEGKLQALQRAQSEKQVVAVVGDGINDAPVLARADASVVMGQGAMLARASADALLLSGRLADLAAAREMALRTQKVIRQNLTWSAVYNFACIPLALAGFLPPWAAGLGMAASSVFVVLNAQRLALPAKAS